jgi:hypothetical protein
MKKTWLASLCLSLCVGFAAVGCGDDEDDNDKEVKVDVPGVQVNAENLQQGVAGAAAPEAK